MFRLCSEDVYLSAIFCLISIILYVHMKKPLYLKSSNKCRRTRYNSFTNISEFKFMDKYKTLSENDIEVRYHGQDGTFAEETLYTVWEARTFLKDYFDIKEQFPKIRVVLTPNRDEFDRLVKDWLHVEIERPSHPSRMAQPQRTDLVVLSPSAYDKYSTFEYVSDEYRRILFHEMTHIFEEYLSPDIEASQRWWGEGLAVFLSGHWKFDDQYNFRKPVLDGIRENDIPNIKDIQSNVTKSYDWGWTIVRFIEITYGREIIVKIVRECSDGNVFAELGENIGRFEKNWKKWLLEEGDSIS